MKAIIAAMMLSVACSPVITTPPLTPADRVAKLQALRLLAEKQLSELNASSHKQEEEDHLNISFSDIVVWKRRLVEKEAEVIPTWILPDPDLTAPSISPEQEEHQQRLDVEKKWMPVWNKLTITLPTSN